MPTATAAKCLLRLCTLAFLLPCVAAQGQESALQLYDVELVIFRVNNPSGTTEDWALEEARAKTTLPQNAESEENTPPSAEPAPPAAVPPTAESSVQPLAGGPTKLTSIEAALRKNRAYTPIAHIGWTQPGFAINNPRPLALETLLPTEAAITGTSSLVRGRYLHLSLELTWMSPIDGKRYVLREQRRMRSGDKHYFDHPHFGVIALITPKEGR